MVCRRRHGRALSQSDRRAHSARRDARGGAAGATGSRQRARAPGHADRAVGDRQRQADPRSRPVEETLRPSLSARSWRSGRASSPGCRGTSASRERSLVVAFEGVDAAGKGGAIRRVTGALDARQYVTVPIAAPTDEELAHPYLWRFWRKIPRARRHHAVRSVLVRPRAGRARRAPVPGRRLDARVCRDQPVRGATDARRRHRRQVLAADQQGRAAQALPGARAHPVQALQDHAR